MTDPQLLTVASTLAVALLAMVTQFMLLRFKKKAEQELEHLRNEFQRLQESAELKKQYSMPLLKASEDLYNKLNGILGKGKTDYRYLKNLPTEIDSLESVGNIRGSVQATYLTSVLYQFVRFWACIEAIRRDIGIIKLSSRKRTRDLHARTRQVVAVFPSGRLHKGLTVRPDDPSRYKGLILEGAQILIAESVLIEGLRPSKCISYTQFCEKLVGDEDFRKSLLPLMQLLGNLVKVEKFDEDTGKLDFRWSKLLIFSKFLRELISALDEDEVVSLLKELEAAVAEHLRSNEILDKNLKYFKKAYPDPPTDDAQKSTRRLTSSGIRAE